MAENNLSKCPYCGCSLIHEEGGYRCRLCKSFFSFDGTPVVTEKIQMKASSGGEDLEHFSMINPKVSQDPEERAYQMKRFKNEFIGMMIALASAVCMALCRILGIPLLMIPGFAFWAGAAAFAGYHVYKSIKAGRRLLYIRVFLLLVVAIMMLFLIKTPK